MPPTRRTLSHVSLGGGGSSVVGGDINDDCQSAKAVYGSLLSRHRLNRPTNLFLSNSMASLSNISDLPITEKDETGDAIDSVSVISEAMRSPLQHWSPLSPITPAYPVVRDVFNEVMAIASRPVPSTPKSKIPTPRAGRQTMSGGAKRRLAVPIPRIQRDLTQEPKPELKVCRENEVSEQLEQEVQQAQNELQELKHQLKDAKSSNEVLQRESDEMHEEKENIAQRLSQREMLLLECLSIVNSAKDNEKQSADTLCSLQHLLKDSVTDEIPSVGPSGGEVSRLQTLLQEKENDLQRLNEIFISTKETIRDLNDALQDKEHQLQHMEETIKMLEAVRGTTEATFERRLQDKDRHITALEKNLEELQKKGKGNGEQRERKRLQALLVEKDEQLQSEMDRFSEAEQKHQRALLEAKERVIQVERESAVAMRRQQETAEIQRSQLEQEYVKPDSLDVSWIGNGDFGNAAEDFPFTHEDDGKFAFNLCCVHIFINESVCRTLLVVCIIPLCVAVLLIQCPFRFRAGICNLFRVPTMTRLRFSKNTFNVRQRPVLADLQFEPDILRSNSTPTDASPCKQNTRVTVYSWIDLETQPRQLRDERTNLAAILPVRFTQLIHYNLSLLIPNNYDCNDCCVHMLS
uniref:Uncharacterized protein n=2 Tax=Eptatretus burgeri TaxID=7764 RepID=A0A8C4QUW9_EPTBU